jgi:hypothetical protein
MHALLPFTIAALSLSAVIPFDLADRTLPSERTFPAKHTEAPESEAVSLYGPPAICLPLEVSGRTLPWGEGILSPAKNYPLKKLRGDLLALLESEDTLTRMENLRRAAITLGPLHRGADAKEQARVRIEILSSLRNRALTALLDPKPSGHAVQCVFDLGYLQAALTQTDGRKASTATGPDFNDGGSELRYAGKALPKDGAVALALALALFDIRGGQTDPAQFMRCAKLVGSDAMLRKNLKTSAHHFLAREDYDELVRSMAK